MPILPHCRVKTRWSVSAFSTFCYSYLLFSACWIVVINVSVRLANWVAEYRWPTRFEMQMHDRLFCPWNRQLDSAYHDSSVLLCKQFFNDVYSLVFQQWYFTSYTSVDQTQQNRPELCELDQWFSTGVPRKTSVPWKIVRCSAGNLISLTSVPSNAGRKSLV